MLDCAPVSTVRPSTSCRGLPALNHATGAAISTYSVMQRRSASIFHGLAEKSQRVQLLPGFIASDKSIITRLLQYGWAETFRPSK